MSCVYQKKQEVTAAGKKLSGSDQTILRRAEELIENELAFVLHLSGHQVGGYIRQKLGIGP